MAKLGESVKKYQAELNVCQEQLRANEDKLSLARLDAEKKQMEIVQLQVRIDSCDHDRSDQLESLSSLQVELLKSQNENESLQSRIKAADCEKQKHDELVESMRVEMEGKKGQLDRLIRVVEERDNDLAALQVANQDLHSQVESVRVESMQLLNSTISERDSLSIKTAEIQAEFEASIEYATELQRSLTEREAEVVELKSRLDAQQLIFRDVALQSSQSQSAASRLQAQLDVCMQECRDRDSLVASLKAEIEESKSNAANHALQVETEKYRRLQDEGIISALTAEDTLLRKSKEPISDDDCISHHPKKRTIAGSGTENYDLMVVLASQVDNLTGSLQRSRLNSLSLLVKLRYWSYLSALFASWKTFYVSLKVNRMKWQTLTCNLCFRARSRTYAAMTGKFTSDRLRRIQEQTHELKKQLLEFMQENENSFECNDHEQSDLQQQLAVCRNERDRALTECEHACEIAAKAKAEYFQASELLLNHQLQVTHLMNELEREKQQLIVISNSREALRAEFDEMSATLVAHQQVMACNSELQRMVVSAEAVSLDYSLVIENAQNQVRAALADSERSASAKTAADRSCEAALRQLEQSTNVQVKQKERILELTTSLNEAKTELQHVLQTKDVASQEVLDLKRSLSSSILQIGQLQEALDNLQDKARLQDMAVVATTRELSAKEEYIRVLLQTLESSGKERQRLEFQVRPEDSVTFF